MRLIKVLLVLGLVILPVQAHAAAKKPVSSGVVTSIAVPRNKQSVNVTFSALSKASSIFYTLSYKANGVDQGAGGTISVKGAKALSRKLLFGTCSSGVCRYHTNIKNPILQVTTTYKNGKSSTQNYKIRL